MLKVTDKTREGLLKKLRIITVVVVGVFSVVAVALVWQFATIIHQKKLTKELAANITELHKQTNDKTQSAEYYAGQEYSDFVAASEYDCVRQ
jgi:uncharacterized protein YpmB